MNKVALTGRLTNDPEITTTAAGRMVARFSVACPRNYKNSEGEYEADFIDCTAFGASAEFLEKYFRKGIKAEIVGHIQTGTYTNKEGKKVKTVGVIVDELGFAESKNSGQRSEGRTTNPSNSRTSGKKKEELNDGFMEIPDGVEDEGLPFN